MFSDDALNPFSAEIDRQFQLLKERSPATVKGEAEAEAEAICHFPQGEAIAQICDVFLWRSPRLRYRPQKSQISLFSFGGIQLAVREPGIC